MVDYSRCTTDEEDALANVLREKEQRLERLCEHHRQLTEVYFALAKHDERDCASYVDKMRTNTQTEILHLRDR